MIYLAVIKLKQGDVTMITIIKLFNNVLKNI